jgi:hypothetical protein
MKRAAALLVMLMAFLAVVPAASAHSTRWHWTVRAVERALQSEGLSWSEGYESVLRADCVGVGNRRGVDYIVKQGRKLFKHHECLVVTDAPIVEESIYYITFHVIGEHRWKPVFDGYA